MFQSPDSAPPIVQETAETAGYAIGWFIGWMRAEVLTQETGIQAAVLLTVAAASIYAGRLAAPYISRLAAREGWAVWLRTRVGRFARLVAPAVALVLVWFASVALRNFAIEPDLLGIAASLLIAWLTIRLITALTRENAFTRLIGAIIWIIAALAILGWLTPLISALDAAAFTAGEMRISLLTIVNGMILIGGLLWFAVFVSGLLEGQLGRLDGMPPAARVLVGKVLRIAFVTVAILVGLTSIGIDFTAVAVFSGAVGVGIGFGLQKVVSNLISGIILLLDRSIKPGDVIEIGEAYGWISKLGARYAAIVTRDGKEYLIPNEDLITQQVVNWSFSNRAVRLKIGVGVSYRSDVRKALDLMMQAARDHSRVLESPPPATRLVGFGDSSVDLELRVWIDDPEGGVVNVASDIRLAIWDLFHENGIEFPFPQRDLHIVSTDGLKDLAKEIAAKDE